VVRFPKGQNATVTLLMKLAIRVPNSKLLSVNILFQRPSEEASQKLSLIAEPYKKIRKCVLGPCSDSESSPGIWCAPADSKVPVHLGK
jgi:hypothetical protein